MKTTLPHIASGKFTRIAIFMALAGSMALIYWVSYTLREKSDVSGIQSDRYEEGMDFLNSGDSLSDAGRTGEALRSYRFALDALRSDSLRDKRAKVLYRMGYCCIEEGRYEEAMQYLSGALSVNDGKNALALAHINNLMGVVWADQGLHREALEKYAIAESIYRAYPDQSRVRTDLSRLFTDIGISHHYLNQNEEEARYFQESFNIKDAIPLEYIDSTNYLAMLRNKGSLYLMMNNADSGLHILNMARSIDSLHKDYVNMAAIEANIADWDFRNGRKEKAINRLRSLLDWKESGKTTFPDHLLHVIFYNLSDYYRGNGNLDQAMEWQDKLMALKDSTSRINRTKQILDIQDHYNEIQEANEIRQGQIILERSLDNQKRAKYLLITLLFLSVVLILYGYRIYKARRIQSELSHQLLMNEKLRLENENQIIERERIELKGELNKMTKDIELNSAVIEEKEAMIRDLEEKFRQALPSEQYPDNLAEIIDSYKNGLKRERENMSVNVLLNESNILFFKRLKEKHPDISRSDARLCTLLYLNLENKEISRILSISLDGVKKGRQRLRRKIGIQPAEDISEYLQKI